MTDKSAKSFSVVIAQLEDGAFNDQISREIQGLIGDMGNHAQVYGGSAKGKVSITLDISLANGVFEIAASKSIVAPKEKKSRSLFWADKDNNLTDENPKQRRFEFDDKVQRLPSQPATA